jgi:hypothetical protein
MFGLLVVYHIVMGVGLYLVLRDYEKSLIELLEAREEFKKVINDFNKSSNIIDQNTDN